MAMTLLKTEENKNIRYKYWKSVQQIRFTDNNSILNCMTRQWITLLLLLSRCPVPQMNSSVGATRTHSLVCQHVNACYCSCH